MCSTLTELIFRLERQELDFEFKLVEDRVGQREERQRRGRRRGKEECVESAKGRTSVWVF